MGEKFADVEFGLDLSRGAQPGEYSVKVVRAAAGARPHSRFTLDIDALEDLARDMETRVLASAARSRRRVVPELEGPLREVGSQLFQKLFSGPIDTAYRNSLAVAGERGEKLRLVLSITAPELAVMPWEALYDHELETYVCLNYDVVRHIDAPYTPDPLPIHPPLRILAIVASPRGLAELNVDAEKQHLETALAGPISAGQVQLDWETQAVWWRVHQRLLQGRWHVLHFIGHGDYDAEGGEGRIALVCDDGRADWVDATKLADLLGEAEPTPRVVVLNSCASAQGGSQDLFSCTAATLVRRGISAVVAMQFSVSDTAAVVFPRGFYTALASGRRVDEAVRSGRIDIRGISDGTLEWVTPILHVRGDANELFQLGGGTPQPMPTVVAPASELQDPREDPQWIEGLAAYLTKRWPQAVEHFESLQTRYPDDQRIETRLQQARRRRDIADWSAKADGGAEQGDWDYAVTALEHLTALDPADHEAASRLEHARKAQRIKSLTDEMVVLHRAGQWEAVVAAAHELAELDPERIDPNGIVGEAEAEIRDARLADRFARALNHLDQENWQLAADLFGALERERPGYRDAASLRAIAEQQLGQLDLADKYRRAAEAQERCEWTTAATLFSEIVSTDAHYRDAAGRRQQCRAAQRTTEAQNALERRADLDSGAQQESAKRNVEARLKRAGSPSRDSVPLSAEERGRADPRHPGPDAIVAEEQASFRKAPLTDRCQEPQASKSKSPKTTLRKQLLIPAVFGAALIGIVAVLVGLNELQSNSSPPSPSADPQLPATECNNTICPRDQWINNRAAIGDCFSITNDGRILSQSCPSNTADVDDTIKEVTAVSTGREACSSGPGGLKYLTASNTGKIVCYR